MSESNKPKSLLRTVLAVQSVFEESETQKHILGQVLELENGMQFRYCQAGGLGLNIAQLHQAPLPVADHFNCIVSTQVIGDTQITITLGATAVTKNQYAEGILHINDGTGQGQAVRVKSHPVIALSDPGVLTLEEGLLLATDVADSLGTLTHNQYKGVLVNAATSHLVGVPRINVTASYFFWAQTKGPCPVLVDGNLVQGQNAIANAGAVSPNAADVAQVAGLVMQANASGDYALINLTIE